MEGTNLNIEANNVGVIRRYVKYCNPMTFSDSTVNINAGNAAMINEGEPEAWNQYVSNHKLCKIYFTNCKVNIDGIYNGTELVDPLDSGVNAAHAVIFRNTTADINALNIAINAAYDYGYNQSYNHKSTYVEVSEGSVVNVTGSMGERKDEFGSEISAIDCESYNSSIDVESGGVLTVKSGWMAMVAQTIYAYADGEIYATTTYPSDEAALGCYDLYAKAANTDDADSKPGKIRINSAASRLGAGQGKYFYSNDVLICTSNGAPTHPDMVSHTTKLGDGIVLMESADGITWQPISTGRNSLETMHYMTTIPQATHRCYENDYKKLTFDEATSTHSGLCIICGQTFTYDCIHKSEIPAYSKHPSETEDGVRYWECRICRGDTPETVPAHECEDHSDNIWVTEDYQYHISHCTFEYGDGKICDNSIIRKHEMTGEYHLDTETIRDECTICDFYREYTGSANCTHVPEKVSSCEAPGNIEFWHCKHCNNYFADEACSIILSPSEVFTQPAAHTYGADDVCTVCGAKKMTLSFVPEEGYPDEYEYYYVIIGKVSNGKYYVMGNDTIDGKREAVEIPADMIGADGTVKLTSEMAEFLYRETIGTSNVSFFADGGCFTFTKEDGFFVYDKEHYGDKCVSYPGYFSPEWDEPGLGEMYAYDKDRDEKVWLCFDEENLCFDVCETEMKNIYLYIQLCEHSGLYHNEAVAPTCTEQGTRDYYGCGKCGTYYNDAAATEPYEFPDYVDPFNPSDVNDYFNIPALRHDFGADGVCKNCNMKRPVYKPVTSLEQFDQLSEDAYYIIVFKDGAKTYAAFLPDIAHINDPLMKDANNNGIVDMMEPDVNANGIPDCIENYIDTYWGSVDNNEDGIKSTEEYNEAIGWMDEDEDVDSDDYKLFFEERMYWDLYYEYDYEIYNSPNIVEVTVAEDGSITIINEGAMEFQMMPSGVWGGQEYDDSELEYENIKETERLRAAWIPNWWVANYGTMGEYGEDHFIAQNRWYGDSYMPGVIDNRNWKISFNADGTALLVSTWADLDDSAALQLVKYTDENSNERITMVGCYDELWQYSDILSSCTVISGAYLYASEPVYAEPPHECDFGEWTEDENGRTHSRECKVEGCDNKQTEEHDWSFWTRGDVDTIFVRYCICGAYEEMTVHKPITDAVIDVTKPEENGANAELVIENVVDLFNEILTEDEQKDVAEGNTTVSIYLEVEDVPAESVPESDRAAVEEAIANEETTEIGMYLDINLFKEVTVTDGDHTFEPDTVEITETPGKVTISIQIPEELINNDSSVNRIYRIIRVHEDGEGNLVTDIIEGIFDPATNTFTFETDKFSTYALAYDDRDKVLGDVSGDGIITNADVLMIYRYIYNATLYPLDVTVGDVNGDGLVTNADVLMIYRYIYNPVLYPIG